MSQVHATISEEIAAVARRLGFDRVGIAAAVPAATAGPYRAWLAAGYHGEMAYLARPDAVAKREDLERILPGVRTVVAVAMVHHTAPLPPELAGDPARGFVAGYARGDDYHDVIMPRLRELAVWIEAAIGQPVAHRAYVDTGPLLERELATRAGLGFVGKNTNLIHPRLGSWLLLGELLLTVELPPWQPEPGIGACGRCTRCLDACPTGAFVAPYRLDARRCIAYLTIELKGPIPRGLRPALGNRIFGCDVCQEVCPWNRRFARPTAEPAFQPRPEVLAPRLLDLIDLDDDGFRRRFRGSPIQRARRRGLLRNVAVALGNGRDPAAVPALVHALHDPEPLVRGHAAWALGRIATEQALDALKGALGRETDEGVQQELRQALSDLWSPAQGA